MIRRFIHTAISLLVAGLVSQAAEKAVKPAPSIQEQLQLAHDVRMIFEKKCLDCHGPELPRPKGKFGYVLDLKRVAGNPDYIVPGEPDSSELFKMIRDDEMPGEDAKVPPLTPEEKEKVKHWIALGAPVTVPPDHPPITGTSTEKPSPAVTAQTAPASSEEPAPALQMPTWKRAIRWVGRFHPVSTHFPVALMYVAVLAEGLAWWTRRESWMQTSRFLVVIGAAGALVAASLGWVNASFASYVGASAAVLKWHRWLGTFTTAWTVMCAVLAVMSESREGSPARQRFRGALMLGAAMVGVSGFLGSALIYGLDHYTW